MKEDRRGLWISRGLCAGVFFYQKGFHWQSVWAVLYLELLLEIAWEDGRTRRIPNRALWLGVFLRLSGLLLESGQADWLRSFWQAIWPGLPLAAVFLALAWFAPARFGMGDAKLLGLMLLFQGTQNWFQAIYWALWAAFFHAAFCYVRSRRSERSIAFAPSLFVGAYLSLW